MVRRKMKGVDQNILAKVRMSKMDLFYMKRTLPLGPFAIKLLVKILSPRFRFLIVGGKYSFVYRSWEISSAIEMFDRV